jgi:ATP synthase in type III secretion protein N
VDFDALRERLSEASSVRAEGRVVSVTGLSVRLRLSSARIGDVVDIRKRGGVLKAEVVGFRDGEVVAMPLGELAGVGPDDPVVSNGEALTVGAGEALLGRVVDGFGRPLDGRPLAAERLVAVSVDRAPPSALARKAVSAVLPTGVRVLDSMLTFGEGQRVGLFAGSGVGKSTLLGAVARGAQADVVVLALVGERGREVGEFLSDCLGPEGLKRSVVVVATSDAPALERLKAAQTATAIAEYFRDRGKKVMLMVDSITRFARAQREVGLATGEPPARRGYPPSVFAALPRLLERTGQSENGSITALYTVLVEGGDMEEPIADEVRGILDGHIVLDRSIAARGWYPAVDVVNSLSRVMDRCVSPGHKAAARVLRRLLSAYEGKRDLITLGAYKKGSDKIVDQAMAALPAIEELLQQDPNQLTPFGDAVANLQKISGKYG